MRNVSRVKCDASVMNLHVVVDWYYYGDGGGGAFSAACGFDARVFWCATDLRHFSVGFNTLFDTGLRYSFLPPRLASCHRVMVLMLSSGREHLMKRDFFFFLRVLVLQYTTRSTVVQLLCLQICLAIPAVIGIPRRYKIYCFLLIPYVFMMYILYRYADSVSFRHNHCYCCIIRWTRRIANCNAYYIECHLSISLSVIAVMLAYNFTVNTHTHTLTRACIPDQDFELYAWFPSNILNFVPCIILILSCLECIAKWWWWFQCLLIIISSVVHLIYWFMWFK